LYAGAGEPIPKEGIIFADRPEETFLSHKLTIVNIIRYNNGIEKIRKEG